MNIGDISNTISNQEFAILCNIVSRRATKRLASICKGDKQALDRLIVTGFVAVTSDDPSARLRPTAKSELLFVELCTGVSAGYAPTSVPKPLLV
jgi:hypothetical protein